MSSPTQHTAQINALGLEAYITHSFSLLSVQHSECLEWWWVQVFNKDSLGLIQK